MGTMKRPFLIPVVLLGALSPSAFSADRPNVLLLITDQHHRSALSATGNPHVKTPALDALAARGVRFERSYCTNPVCCPARASLFTGRMPHAVGINDNRRANLPADLPSLGRVFREAGYETAYAGKWHLPVPYPAYAEAKKSKIPGFDVLPLAGDGTAGHEETGKGLAADGPVADAAAAFLRGQREKPFLLVVSILNPHDTCETPDHPQNFRPLLGTPPAPFPPLPPNFGPSAGEPPAARERRGKLKEGLTAGWTQDRWREYAALYYRLAETADGHLGRVLAALKEGGLSDQTVVLWTSDHGEMLGAHGLMHKQEMYEEAAGVPLIVAPPAAAKAAVDATHLVSGVDVLPTLCDYAGIAPPEGVAGRSLRPLVEGREIPWRDQVVVEMGDPPEARMLRTARHKYVAWAGAGDREQLFDLESDPGEMTNLAKDPAVAEVLKDHRRRLREWVRDAGDSFQVPE